MHINREIAQRTQRGDTLVEVLVATVILALVLAGAYTLSNRSAQLSRQSHEKTYVSGLLQQQLESVRSARDQYQPSAPSAPESVPWVDITTRAVANVTDLGGDCNDLSLMTGVGTRGSNNPFHVTNASGLAVSPTIQQLDNLYYLWVEIEQGPASSYWEAHAYACWQGFGDAPVNKASSVLRLADPDA